MKTFLRRLEILNYLRTQNQHVSTDDIILHLTNAGYLEEDGRLDRSKSRLIQRDLNFLLGEEYEPNEFENEFGLSRLKGDRKSQLWRLEPYQELNYDFERIPAFMALALSVTQKHLKQVLPSTTQQELQRIFLGAQEKLSKSEQKLSPLHYQRLTEAVEFFQRGQRLQSPQFDMTTLDAIYRAILTTRRIRFQYRSRNQTKHYDLHPFGVAIMLPKIYLIGIKDEDIEHYSERDFRSFLIHKIEDVELSAFANKVPAVFKLKEYLESGNMDVLIEHNDSDLHTLRLEISIVSQSNLISDLQESPISPDQKLEHIQDNVWKLTANVKRTVQLRNWLLALGPDARVIEPAIIRQDLINYLSAMQGAYS